MPSTGNVGASFWQHTTSPGDAEAGTYSGGRLWTADPNVRVGAQRLLLVGQTEWDEGKVRVKNLAEREEDDVPLDEL